MKKLLFLFLLPLFLSAQDIRHLELDDINGDLFIMQENLEYDATVISFWATWCLPCKKEHPALQQLKKDLSDYKIQIITISIDSPRSLAKVKKYVKSNNYDFTYLLDPSGDASRELLVNEVPYTLLADKNGKIVYKHSGYRQGDEEELKAEILKLVNGD